MPTSMVNRQASRRSLVKRGGDAGAVCELSRYWENRMLFLLLYITVVVLSWCCLGSGVLTSGKLKVAWGSNRKLAGLFGGSGTGFKWRAGWHWGCVGMWRGNSRGLGGVGSGYAATQ